MRCQDYHPSTVRSKQWLYWLFGLGSLIWLLLRSGMNPRRLAYPCQRAALLNSIAFLGYPLSVLGSARLYQRASHKITISNVVLPSLAFLITIGLSRSVATMPDSIGANLSLPAWTSPEAVSNVFAVEAVPVPDCSLAGGNLPPAPPCNNPDYALRDQGVETLVQLMESQGTYFYQTTQHPQGILGENDVVVIKINNQWGGRGTAEGAGRLASNTDVLKGLIWSILQHPEGFSGEIVVAENAQPTSTNNWDVTPANAEDQDQSFRDVVTAFQSLGYPVSLYDWTTLNNQRIHGGSISDSGYPNGEYAQGDMSDAYILLEDPAGTATDELSYPKFRTPNGNYVSMRYGVWDGCKYQADRLTFINLPVLKRHGMAGATIAWKNMIGFITADGYSNNRFGGYNEMHNYFFGFTNGPGKDYGLAGRELALIRAPDLNIVDAIWVAFESNYNGNAVRQDVLLASTDPLAVDWYASEYLLLPLTGNQGTSAARGGVFRNASRINQNAARLVWPGGSENYPYMDLLDDYDGNTPAEGERDQLDIYVTRVDPLFSIYLPVSIRDR